MKNLLIGILLIGSISNLAAMEVSKNDTSSTVKKVERRWSRVKNSDGTISLFDPRVKTKWWNFKKKYPILHSSNLNAVCKFYQLGDAVGANYKDYVEKARLGAVKINEDGEVEYIKYRPRGDHAYITSITCRKKVLRKSRRVKNSDGTISLFNPRIKTKWWSLKIKYPILYSSNLNAVCQAYELGDAVAANYKRYYEQARSGAVKINEDGEVEEIKDRSSGNHAYITSITCRNNDRQ